MIVTKMALPRRTFLSGVGVTLALPLLDAMVPALTAQVKTPANPVRRLSVVYAPNGMAHEYWKPKEKGSAFEFTPILQPLAPFRDQLLVLSGLSCKPHFDNFTHANASTRFLTGVEPKVATNSSEIAAGVSMDQLAARELGRHTPLASLELNLDPRDTVGICTGGLSCAYANTISWRDTTTPMPMEDNPRVIFERLFGDDDSTDPSARLARIQQKRSILDSVGQKVARLQRGLGPSDRTKLGNYLDALRDVEQRIQVAERKPVELPIVEQPAGIPATFQEHAALMFDLQLLAYQGDLTRIITFMLGREVSGRSYPEIGVAEAHHPLSHHEYVPEKIALMSKINVYHTMLFAQHLEKLRSTTDGDGSLLDHLIILYGGGMSDSNQHDPRDLPLLLVGGGAGQMKGGSHVAFAPETPATNLHLTLLDKLGVPAETLGESSGKLELLSGV